MVNIKIQALCAEPEKVRLSELLSEVCKAGLNTAQQSDLKEAAHRLEELEESEFCECTNVSLRQSQKIVTLYMFKNNILVYFEEFFSIQ